MKYRVHLNKEPKGTIQPDGSSYITDFSVGTNTIDWTLLDNAVAQTFIESFNMVAENTSSNDISPPSWIAFNNYKSGGQEPLNDWLNSLDKLNEDVNYAKAQGFCDFDDTFICDPKAPMLDILAKCNAIHYEFESKLLDHQKQLETASAPGDASDFKACLERLNTLVHTVEKGPIVKPGVDNFVVIRYNSDHVSGRFPKITQEHYKCFQQNVENGDLFSDFFTVGKDLGHAYHTNDKLLVENKECKQQSVISASVHCGWNKTNFGNKSPMLEHQGGVYRAYQQWCEWVEADKHGYNYWEPTYNLGRAPIARCEISDYTEFNKIWTDTPWISKVELID
jgi:hypothetical protein|tara:strand:- start:3509 stop:4519 length:1011 start_codon:yes stop_codon:yes gene_type:complete